MRANFGRRLFLFTIVIVSFGCGGQVGAIAKQNDGGSVDPIGCIDEEADGGSPDDRLSPMRLLRRTTLVLLGRAPEEIEYNALSALPSEAEQRNYVAQFARTALQSPQFYENIYGFGRSWLNVPLTPAMADEPDYGLDQQRGVVRCSPSTANAGRFVYVFDQLNAGNAQAVCGGVLSDGGVPEIRSVEPWWAPGSTIELVGSAAQVGPTALGRVNGGWTTISCEGIGRGGCGCGPAAVRCIPDVKSHYGGWDTYAWWNEGGQRRQLADEPGRLWAHLAWHDRPLTDLVLGTRSVGTTTSIAAYVAAGVTAVNSKVIEDDVWWRPTRFSGEPTDPLHSPGDPNAWREFDLEQISQIFISDRNYHYDSRVTPTTMKGVPSAGMLTSLGFLGGLPRERLRAARALEILGCEVLAPPEGLQFNLYVSDPATEGPCQHCHRRIDPAAIHFKRFAREGLNEDTRYHVPGLGNGKWPAGWRQGVYPYRVDPFLQWNRWYRAVSVLTPVTQAEVDADPMAVFIDFLPPNQSLFGKVSDGTIGPLGFAKLLVASGNFDKCVVRQLHRFTLGRDIDPAEEAGYLDALTSEFLKRERKARPFIEYLMSTPAFERGF